MKRKNDIYYILITLAASLVYFYNLPQIPGFVADIGCWEYWAFFGKTEGLVNVYHSETNYFPLYHYILRAYAACFETKAALHEHMYLLRLVTFIFDIAGVYVVYRWLNRKTSFWLLLMISVLNLSFCYNSLIWGQVDSILAAFVIASLYFLWNRKYIPAALFLALSICFKLQAIIFIPVFGLLLLIVTPKAQWLSRLLQSLGTFLLCTVCIVVPFITNRENAQLLSKVLFSLVDQYPRVTFGAGNFWSIFYGIMADHMLDAEFLFAGLSYKRAGLLLFALSSLAAFIPLLRTIYDKFRGADHPLSLPVFILSTALIGLSFYFFNTQIHERYSHPVFIFLLLYAFLRKDFVPYILFSIAYFLNMESILQWLHLPNYNTAIFSRYFVGSLYAILLIYLFIRLYQLWRTERRLQAQSTIV